MLPQLALAGGSPVGLADVAEPRGDPAELGERVPLPDCRRASRVDCLPERGPARLAVLPGDRELRVVQRGELPGRAPPLRLNLEVPQARLLRQRALTAHNLRVTAGPDHRGETLADGGMSRWS